MESLFILIPLSVVAVACAVIIFFRMNRDGQFDDDQGPAWSILLDDDRSGDGVGSDTSVDKDELVSREKAKCNVASDDASGTH